MLISQTAPGRCSLTELWVIAAGCKGEPMPRPRINDPSNLPIQCNPTSDPVRETELVSEFQCRLGYIITSYSTARKVFEDNLAYNRSLRRLKRGLARKRRRNEKQSRLHPEIEFVISWHARRLALAEGVEVGGHHIRDAAFVAAEKLAIRRGRPGDAILRHHVSGLMATLQEFSGKPIIARRTRDSVYQPHFADGVSQLIPHFFENKLTGITVTRLARMVEGIRAEYAGKTLRFTDLFPGYGAELPDAGSKFLPKVGLECFEVNIPIYCH